MGNIENPPPELEISSAKTTSELLRPFRCRSRLIRRLDKGNRPSGENSQHDDDASKMRRMEQGAPVSLLPNDCDDNAVEEQKMNGTFRQPAEPKKNKRHRPNQPC